MLQARSENGKLVTPAICSVAEIERMRSTLFYCPDCQEQVILRAGQKVTPHFSHRAAASCSRDSQKGEGEYHRLGKIKLYQWFRRQKLHPVLEVYLPEIEQRPDLLLHEQGKTFAIEFQCADIEQEVWLKRTTGYLKQGIRPIWVIGANRFKRTGKQQLKLLHWMLLTLQQAGPDSPTSLYYFCPLAERFIIASDLHLQTSTTAFARLELLPATQLSFSYLFQSSNLSDKMLYHHWISLKSNFRLQRNPSQGVALDFRHWLYEQGWHPEQLPAIICLPNRAQHWMRLPLWQWQSLFILSFLDPLPKGKSFQTEDVHDFLRPYQWAEYMYPLCHLDLKPGELYLQQLACLQIVELAAPDTWVKRREIRYFATLEEALIGDRLVIEHLFWHTPDKLNEA